MIFVADEGVDSAVVSALRNEKYQVFYIAEMSPGLSDDEVLDQANEARALLITEDKDFGELVFRLGRIHGGVILLRLHGLNSAAKAELVTATVRAHGTEMTDAFTVISHRSVRIRPRIAP